MGAEWNDLIAGFLVGLGTAILLFVCWALPRTEGAAYERGYQAACAANPHRKDKLVGAERERYAPLLEAVEALVNDSCCMGVLPASNSRHGKLACHGCGGNYRDGQLLHHRTCPIGQVQTLVAAIRQEVSDE